MSLYENTNVVSITDDDCILKKNPSIRPELWRQGDEGYLKVFAPWCPHCQSKVPLWTKLANENNTNSDTKFIIMSSDIDNEGSGLAREAGVTGVPTLFFIHKDGSMEKIPSGQSGPMSTDWSEADLKSRIPKSSKATTKTSKATPKVAPKVAPKSTATSRTAAKLPSIRGSRR